MLISLSGVLMPGPLFAVTIQKATKSKIAGALIALGHGIIEFPLMFLIYFLLSQFAIPNWVQISIGLVGGSLMVFMGFKAFKDRNRQDQSVASLKRDSLFAGVWTTAISAGFILWWLTIGTALVLNAQMFGLVGFGIFAGVHWSIDFLWYTIVGLAIFKSQRFLTPRVRCGITLFCVGVFLFFGVYFIGSALMSVLTL
ncbi:MAG: LysE family translocator [Nitrososphaerota archaeon]|nr:LysE family translocator [Nitrososphaerota archaeon]